MKYNDMQRIEKMRGTTQKLLAYLEREHITAPLYNIREQALFICYR